ncbi:hypothetical protein [Qaidamihabitans albus]|uniref:hypothetical protein n=1 Tax=Qaidamihabitans albus TaxID=2795733 RepID=UPI0018F1BE8B|nr:hypothetical protein [Qaidamihabitans albus]
MTNHRITARRPERAEPPAVAEPYTAANLHDPVLSWVIDDEDARQRLTIGTWPETMVAHLESILHSGELLIAEDEPGAVAGISIGSGSTTARNRHAGPASPEGAQFIEHAYGEYADRMELLIELTGQRHPKAGAYWYLLNIVVGSDRRRAGHR